MLYYLNLDERLDRRYAIEQELAKLARHVAGSIRVPGKLTKENGMIGCTASHIRAITHFLVETDYDCAIIIEDDLEITANPDDISQAFQIIRENTYNIDCLLLAYSLRVAAPVSNNLIRVLSSFGCAAYVITRSFGYELVKRFLTTHELVEKHKHTVSRNAANALWGNDVLWCELQANRNVFAFNPRLGKQRKSYSNIQEEITDYGV
jgi:hypothetical protein